MTDVDKMGFSPRRGDTIPINVKFDTGSGLQVRYPVQNFTFIGAEMWEYSPQKCQKLELVCKVLKKLSTFVRV